MKTEQRHVVAKVDELSEGSRKLVYLAGREIGVFHVAGHYYALRNVCPHKGAPICKGRIRPQIYSTGVGEVAFQREGEIIKCPWHLWEFDLTTGASLHDDDLKIATYRVAQEGDEIVVYL